MRLTITLEVEVPDYYGIVFNRQQVSWTLMDALAEFQVARDRGEETYVARRYAPAPNEHYSERFLESKKTDVRQRCRLAEAIRNAVFDAKIESSTELDK